MPRTYLIGQPVDCHNSPVGRATKGYVGLDMQDRRMVFIKDQWRAVAPGAHPELETYERLRKHKVGCVATCLGGGDVISKDGTIQRTLTRPIAVVTFELFVEERGHKTRKLFVRAVHFADFVCCQVFGKFAG